MRDAIGKEKMAHKDMPLISVIMCVRNSGACETLKQAMDSILHQTWENIELILCDDASDPETQAFLEDYRRQDTRLHLLRNEQNCGVAASLNRCLRECRGSYIARMDGDDVSAPNRLELEYLFLRDHPEYAFVGTNCILMNEDGVWGSRTMPEIPQASDFLAYSPYVHPSIMGRREFFLCDGGYQESRSTWRCEDYELFMRRYCQGYYGYNLQQNLYYYWEDKNAYKRRKFRFCLAEAQVRFRGYCRMHIMGKGGGLYWLKPICVGLLPRELYWRWKQKKYQRA